MVAEILRIAFWVFILLLALSFLGISVQSIIQSPAGQSNFGYAVHLISAGWDWLVALGRHWAGTGP